MTQVGQFLDKAQENIAAARLLISDGFFTIAVSRAYYAMFYTAEALLFTRGLAYSSHSAVIAAYGKEFAKTGILAPEFHRQLIEAFEIRQFADYRVETSILSAEKANAIIDRAGEFLEAGRTYISNLGEGEG
jgi:uncharacterized protein (UPF0332 family)